MHNPALLSKFFDASFWRIARTRVKYPRVGARRRRMLCLLWLIDVQNLAHISQRRGSRCTSRSFIGHWVFSLAQVHRFLFICLHR